MAFSLEDDEEYRKLLREALDKPMEWYDERAKIAVEGRKGKTVKGRKAVGRGTVRVPRKR